MVRLRFAIVLALVAVARPSLAAAVRFDFRNTRAVQQWNAQHDVASIRPSAEGMAIAISGEDPYIAGPPRTYRPGTPLWLRVRLKTETDGMAQVFWFTAKRGPSERDSVRFPARAGAWNDIRVPMPPLGPGTLLRLDPPGDRGTVVVASIELSPRRLWREPVWPKPPAMVTAKGRDIVSGDVTVRQTGTFDAFSVIVAGKPIAVGHARPLIGYVVNGRERWLDVNRRAKTVVSASGGAVAVRTTARDRDGGVWSIRRRFSPGPSGVVNVATTVSCSLTRRILYLPMLMLLPGVDSFGARKDQALFPGLEYLDRDEPSSSEKDIVGPGSHRRVPDNAKVTMPLMVVQRAGRYVGLTWNPSPSFSALFDSPDRTFHSGGHALGVLFPGSDGLNREEGSLLPYDARTLPAGRLVSLSAAIIGGRAGSVVPSVRCYADLHPLPDEPDPGLDWDGYAALAAAGWLDSGIRAGGEYAHAYPGSFKPQPAADAALWMDYLAGQTADATLSKRLRDASTEAIAAVPPGQLNSAGVAHVRYPVPALLYGRALDSVRSARQEGLDALKRFEPDGSIRYTAVPGHANLGRTHFAPDANGLTSAEVVRVLNAAMYTGDATLRQEGLRLLDALGKYSGTTPRGAQTWEVPLHTPDILASANLVNAYILGYELTHQPAYLVEARYWAWTGVPFVYLVKPVEGPIGLYGTIAVFGATQWVAPNWMGLPVQWCGLVYADALAQLARYDQTGPWQSLIDGIAASGIQQTHPRTPDSKRQGLLPDSFALHAQIRNDVAINPGTLLPSAVRLYRRTPVYDRWILNNCLIVHAPGAIEDVSEQDGRYSFTVKGWPSRPYQVLIVGWKASPGAVRVNGGDPDAEYDATLGALAVTVNGTARIELETR